MLLKTAPVHMSNYVFFSSRSVLYSSQHMSDVVSELLALI